MLFRSVTVSFRVSAQSGYGTTIGDSITSVFLQKGEISGHAVESFSYWFDIFISDISFVNGFGERINKQSGCRRLQVITFTCTLICHLIPCAGLRVLIFYNRFGQPLKNLYDAVPSCCFLWQIIQNIQIGRASCRERV